MSAHPVRIPQPRGRSQAGFTLVEVLIVVGLGSLLMVSLGDLTGRVAQARTATRERNALAEEAEFALERMVRAVRGTSGLLLPLPENPATPHSESVRDVLAVLLDPRLDRDGDGFADADNDRDGQVDEDPGDDAHGDGKPGIKGVDDDGDGAVDEDHDKDDDEDGAENEDPANGIDDDGDGAVDEDPPKDRNDDGKPGTAGVDDDGDHFVDEGSKADDDEDGSDDEDWLDPVVFRLNGSTLLERTPNPNDGAGYVERVIATGVSQFRVERRTKAASDRAQLVSILLELTGPQGARVALASSVRVGSDR